MNEIIDQIIELLKKLRKENKPKQVILSSGVVNVSAKINKKSKRITLYSNFGQTELQFNNRKAETIRHLANCMMQAYEICEDKYKWSE